MHDDRERLRTGRPLDDAGEPTDGPALSLDPEGPAAERLAAADRPLASHPGGRNWAVLLDDGTDGRPTILQWLAPDAIVPPAHVHPVGEPFEVLEGTLTVVQDGTDHHLDAGEAATVEAGVEHTFRNDTDGWVAFTGQPPSMRTVRALHTLWGLDHDGAYGPDGEPGPLQALAIATDLGSETRTAALPAPLQRAVNATVGRAAQVAGLGGIEDRFLEPSFWERHVEQPDL